MMSEAKKTYKKFSDKEKMEYVKRYYKSQPISIRRFCEKNNLCKTTFQKWKKAYYEKIAKESVYQNEPLDFNANQSTEPGMVTISYIEYLELRQIAIKYNMISTIF